MLRQCRPLAADRSEIVADVANDTSLQMASMPSTSAAPLVSSWQSGAAALRYEVDWRRTSAPRRGVDDDGVEWGVDESSGA